MTMEILGERPQMPIAEHKFDIGNFKFYSNVMTGEFRTGVHVTKELAMDPILMAQKVYGDKTPFVYISHRKNSYSMDTMGYKEVASMFPNLRGIAVVSQNKYRRMLVALERAFIKKPIGVFDNLENAFFWAEKLLEKNS